MKRILTVALLLLTVLCSLSAVYAHELKFDDVSPESWYYNDVSNAVSLGIVNGKSESVFAPDDNLTYAEAIKLAACMHQLYTEGVVTLENGNPWYSTYLEYCLDNSIITTEFFGRISKPDEYATRAGYMMIFSDALPDEALQEINFVSFDTIPDVAESAQYEYSAAVYKLYRAGILQGVDADHNCKPMDNIKRCEVAAIITRMMDENERIHFNIGNPDIVEEKPETNTEDVDKPEIYPEFLITGQPVYKQSANEGEVVRYWTVAAGGKEPYTYKWYTYNARYGNTPVENGEYIKGADTDTLEFKYSVSNPYANSTFVCVVTDAFGSKAESKTVKAPEAMFVGIPDSEIYKHEDGFILNARVQSGSIKPGQWIFLYSETLKLCGVGLVDKMVMFGKDLDEAKAGNNAGLLIDDFISLSDTKYLDNSYRRETLEKLYQMNGFIIKAPLQVAQSPTVYADIGEAVDVDTIILGGRSPYTCKWQVSTSETDGFSDISGSNHDYKGINDYILTDSSVTIDDYKLFYRCVVTDADGISAFSPVATKVLPETQIYITKDPADVTADYGDTAHFYTEIITHNNNPVKYRWQIMTDYQKDFADIEEADSWARGFDTNHLEIDVDMSSFTANARFRCIVSDTVGHEVISKEAVIVPKSMYIMKQPKTTSGKHATAAKFSVEVIGGKAPYSYRWQMAMPSYDGEFRDIGDYFANFEGQSTAVLSVIVNEKELTEEYKFRCVITDAEGKKVTSKSAYVIVTSDASVSNEKRGTSEDKMIVIIG